MNTVYGFNFLISYTKATKSEKVNTNCITLQSYYIVVNMSAKYGIHDFLHLLYCN